MADPILADDVLAGAHDALDLLIEKARGNTADNVWIQSLNAVSQLNSDQQRQNLALLLTVAIQRLAQPQRP